MARLQTKGTCHLCKTSFGKTAMTRHLQKCVEAHAGAPPKKAKPAKLFQLLVQGQHNSEYWLYVECPATAQFGDLDEFLRDLWLECCGHMSAFRIKELERPRPTLEDLLRPSFSLGDPAADEDAVMNRRLGDVLRVGMQFGYEYDFGSTTALTLKVVGEREGFADRKAPVRLLARNEPPALVCIACGAAATQVCCECQWDTGGWLCESCAQKHECDNEMFLPVVNSPRVGVCGYTGH